jgi:hypothetical protein
MTAGSYNYAVKCNRLQWSNFASNTVIVALYAANKPSMVWMSLTHWAPNSSKWDSDLGAGGWGNNEFQYTNRVDNVVVSYH